MYDIWQTIYQTTELREHHMKCLNFFSSIQNGDEIYIHLDNLIAENKLYVRATLLSNEMILYDEEILATDNERNNLLYQYRPYFASFLIPVSQDLIKKLKQIENVWYKGRFLSTQSELQSSENELVLDGILETSASPVNYLQGKLLIFKNKSLNQSEIIKINSTYKITIFSTTSNTSIENYLNTAWNQDYLNTIDIYNVGHGNADYIRGSNNRILYDVGYSYRKYPKLSHFPYSRAATAIRYMKPSYVVLSHWDIDHIIGCAYAEQSLFAKKWIAPNLRSSSDSSPSINAIRLALYLKLLGNLYLVDRDQGQSKIATISCTNHTEIILWLGGGTDTKISARNREGLIIEIKGNHQDQSHILLAGDVPYNCIPDVILKSKIDFLHVPHHCSDMDLNKLNYLSSRGTSAIISPNRRNTTIKNLDTNHEHDLKKKFDSVICTIDHTPTDDDANLSIQIDYRTNRFIYR